MKKIEYIYCVLTEENGEEKICGLSGGGLKMQCVSSEKELMERAMGSLREIEPDRVLKIVKFIRTEE